MLAPDAQAMVFARVFPGRYEVVLERFKDGVLTWTSRPVEVEINDVLAEAVLRL